MGNHLRFRSPGDHSQEKTLPPTLSRTLTNLRFHPKVLNMKGRTVTYSPSVTITVTHDCPKHCLYCGFRTDREGLISWKNIQTTLNNAHRFGATEVLIMSGEEVEKFPHIREQLKERGYKTFVDFVYSVCETILENGFLPHTNIGIMTYDELAQLREVNASMGLMLESVDPGIARKVQPQKNLRDRIRTLEEAGRLKIPYTSGILIGMGESVESRFESLRVLADLQKQYGHLQEIIIQNYVPNRGSRLRPYPLSLEEYKELIAYSKEIMPGVAVQIPPNLNPYWLDLIEVGAEDLGGISPEGDHVNIDNPWDPVTFYQETLAQKGYHLSKRLPVYAKYYQTVLSFPGKIGKYLKAFINSEP